MTVAQLVNVLSKLPPDAKVFCDFAEGYIEPDNPVLLPSNTVWIWAKHE